MNKKQESNCACCQVVDFSKDGFKHLMRHAVFEREAKIDICKTNLILNFRPNEDEYPEFARINAMLVEADRVIVTQKQTKRLINELIETQGIGLFVDRACLGLRQKKRIAPLSYVWGEIELMPLGGTYRHSTNWIMLNKVKLDLRSGEKTMAVTFCDSQTCYLLPTSPQMYFENKRNCRYIYEKEHQVIGEVLNAFNLNKTIEICGAPADVQLINISPVQRFKTSLKNLDPASLNRKVFIEALACEGGCTAGPGGNTSKAGLEVVSDILNYSHLRDHVPAQPEVVVDEKFEPAPIEKPKYPISSIAEALALIGKYSQEDELNCGGCGYNTCHGLAKALLAGEAEPSMCQAYMRKLAARKASAMLRCMPSAVVIVDADLNIVETNEAFVKMFAPELLDLFKLGADGIAGAQLEKILPCTGLFKNTLKTGLETHKEHYPIGEKLYDISLFEIDAGKLVGAIITDVTKTQLRREQIAKKAQEVIEKNIATVQNIACLLGEHMVDTELLLSQIADGYKQEDDE